MRVRVAALVLRGDEVLLVSTGRGAPGYLVPPGGGVEDGETLAEAVEREVREEAELAVHAGPLVAYRELVHEGRLSLELYLRAELAADSVPSGGEDRRVRWVAIADLPATPHFPDQLADLCQAALAGRDGAAYLGRHDY